MALVGAQFVNAVSPNPVGSLQAYAGASAPTGWLLCNGSEQAISTYPELYSVLGTTYGTLTNGSGGAGSTHFRLPDLRGRMPMGAGTGAQNGGSGSGVISGGTTLTARSIGQFGGDERLQEHSHDNYNTQNGAGGGWAYQVNTSASWNGTTYPTGFYGIGNVRNTPVGSGQNMPPFLVTNYIIKAIPDAPRSGLAYGSTPPIVTALPANPQFGDVVTYIADATNGVAWNLQYDATGTYPWKFIGGPPVTKWEQSLVTTTANTSNVDLGGPNITIPLAGDYLVGMSAWLAVGAVANGHYVVVNIAYNGTSLGAGYEIGMGAPYVAGNYYSLAMQPRVATLATASQVLSMRYNSNPSAGTSGFQYRNLIATPIRVKAA